ncbi:hypothetical protein BD413DRAFT_609720 [Trametes elegans]|nr:hypothetical protein BD413DRAFT_609720 [Trametes elegans]
MASATSTSENAAPTQTFAFTGIPDVGVVSCASTTLNWTYTGPPELFSLTASTSIVPHTDAETETPPTVFNAPVALNIPVTLGSYTWAPVNLSGGWYTLQATGADFMVRSSQFLIATGTDTACLSGTSTSTSSSSITTTPSGISTIATTTSTSPATPAPVSNAATSSRTRTGAIVGGVIGGLVIIGAVIAAYIYFGLCRRTPSRFRRRALDDSDRPARLGKWGGLSSRDSGMDIGLPMSNAPTSGKPPLVLGLPKRRATTDSTGAILSPMSSTAHGHSVSSRRVSEEDASTIGDEKLASFRGLEFFQGVPPPPMFNRRRSSASTSSAVPHTPTSEPPSARGSLGRARARSSSQSHRALALAKLDGDSANSPPSSVPPTPRTRSPTTPRRSIDSMQLRTFDSHPVPMQMAPRPHADAAAPKRASAGPNPRRATRKPVPLLNEADIAPAPTGPAPSLSSASSATIARGSSTSSSRSPPPSAHPMYHNNSGSGSGSTLRAQGVVPHPPAPARQPSREDLAAAGMELPSLNHKSSFGDMRPVHYLMPDMPPPSRG